VEESVTLVRHFGENNEGSLEKGECTVGTAILLLITVDGGIHANNVFGRERGGILQPVD